MNTTSRLVERALDGAGSALLLALSLVTALAVAIVA